MRIFLIFILLAGVLFSCNQSRKQPDKDDLRWIEAFKRSDAGNLSLSNPDSALKLAAWILRADEQMIETSLRIRAGIEAGNVYYYRSEIDSAFKYYQEAYLLARENDLTQQKARLLHLMANIKIDRQEYTEAKALLSSAMKLNREISNTEQIAANFSSFGVIYDENYLYDSAVYFYNKATSIFDSTGDIENKAIIQGNLSSVYNSMQQFNKAITLQKQIISIFDSLSNKQQLVLAYNKLGNALQNLEKYDSALICYQYSYKLATEFGNDFSALIAKFNTGKMLSKLKRYDEGEQIIFEIDQYCRENELIDGRLRCMLLLGQNYAEQHSYDLAEEYFNQGLSLAEEDDYPYFKEAFLDELIELNLERTGNIDLAGLYEKLGNIGIEIGQQEMQEKIAELETRFETAKKEKTLLAVQKENQLNKLRSKTYLVIAAVTLVAAFFIFLFFKGRVKILKQKHLLADQQRRENNVLKEKAELQAKLHEETIKNQQLVMKRKDQELVYNALVRAKTIEFFHRLKEKIIPFQARFKTRREQQDFQAVIHEMETANNIEAMGQFEKVFKELHPGFYKSLSDNFPGLTNRELQLCAMLRLNMSTKDIAEVTFLAPTSVDTARSRIRKKMNLDSDANFLNELMKY